MNFGFLRKKEFIWAIVLVAIFLALRLPNIHYPYHQDEYKWVQYSHPEIIPEGTVPHPPLTEFIYAKTLGPIVGDDNFRLIPLTFGLFNLFLIFYLAKIIFDPFGKLRASKAAFWTAFLFAVSFYSVLASLMVDVDGAVMPTFFLVMAIGYYKLRISNFKFQISNKKDWIWVGLLVVGAVGGFLIKVSAILPIFAIFLDFLIEKGVFSDKKRIIKYTGFGLLGVVVLATVLFLAKYVFPFFNLEYAVKYWEHFWNSSTFLSRGWMQTFIQFAKSILYTSPLLLLPVFFVDKEIWRKTRPFFFFIFAGLFFYLVVFDFSLGALDRYLQFLVVTLCIISGAVFAKIFGNKETKLEKEDFITVSVIIVSIFALQFFNHLVPPLYPKTEWISRMISLKWNFLYPFSGGSGPLPFYISFLFMVLVWICSVIFSLSALKIKNIKKRVLFCILVLGILYNSVFIEEYLFGKINGSTSFLVKNSADFIKNDNSISKVTVYNDNGGFNIMETGKYRKRLYIDPKFDINDKIKTLNTYKEFYLVIDIPHIDPNTVYAKYFSSCKTIYNQKSKQISALIYNCQNVPDIKI
jgi:hypothetical protein